MFGALGKMLFGKALGNLAESFIDNVIRDTVSPVEGSIVYCDLAFGNAEHSGVYVGNGKIVHLDGSGRIEMVSPSKFMDRIGGINSAISIYVSCDDEIPVGSKDAARRAKEMVGIYRNYNLVFDNCHQFTAGCITGNFENPNNFWSILKETARLELSANTWRVWGTDGKGYV